MDLAHFWNTSGAYEIKQSLRFDGSARFSKTFASDGNRKTFTISFWVKNTTTTIGNVFNQSRTNLRLNTTNAAFVLNAGYGSTNAFLTSNASFRDPSAWYHFVLAFDTTQSTASDRVKIWVNNQLQTYSSATYPPQNQDLDYNSTNTAYIGAENTSEYLNGYLAEYYSVDGTALTPSSFGETDTITGAWIPKKYGGSYGTNGFYLKFESSGIGTDSSGNGNHWTATGFNTLEGTGQYSQYGDNTTTNPIYTWQKAFNGDITSIIEGVSPPDTNGASTTWDTTSPIAFTKLEVLVAAQVNANGYLTVNGTTIGTGTFTKDSTVRAYDITSSITSPLDTITVHKAFSVSTNNGLWLNGVRINDVLLVDYSAAQANDVKSDTPTNNYATLNPAVRPYPGAEALSDGNLTLTCSSSGVSGSAWATTLLTTGKWYYEATLTTAGPSNNCVGFSNNTIAAGAGTYTADARTYGWFYQSSGEKTISATTTSYGASYTTGDVIGVALDIDAATITFYKNNTSQGQLTGLSLASGSSGWLAAVEGFNGTVWNVNFGQRAFAYTPPTGYKALSTGNLPEPTIKKGSKYFDTVLWTGDGADSRALTGLGFQPDMVWIKARNQGYSHQLFDAVRGAGGNSLQPNLTAAEGAEGTGNGYLSAFNSDGFTVATTANDTYVNASSTTYAAWSWDANGAGSSNTAGTITSTVSANATAGFSIVTYTGNGGGDSSIGHGLGVSPAMIITKGRAGAAVNNWITWHKSFGVSDYIALNLANAKNYGGATTNLYGGSSVTPPSSTTYNIGIDINTNTATYVAYCFSEVAGYSKFGSYTGNGSTDGPFVFCGFRPAWVLFKPDTAGTNWSLVDTKRSTYNPTVGWLVPNDAGSEPSASLGVDFLSNGFKLRTTGNPNNSGVSIIFAAFAEHPFKYANAR